MVAGAVYELYTADDIYSISGELLAAADTLLGTATTDENGLAYFDVDVPLRGEHYGSSDAHDWTTNSGRYYLREISVPDGYLIEQSVIPVEFTTKTSLLHGRSLTACTPTSRPPWRSTSVLSPLILIPPLPCPVPP